MTTLAIDIGGTKIAAAVCDENDAITHRWRVPTPMDADAINHHIANIYHEAVAAGHDDIQAIGISAVSNVGADRHTLTFAANIPRGSTTTCPSTSARSSTMPCRSSSRTTPTAPAGANTCTVRARAARTWSR